MKKDVCYIKLDRLNEWLVFNIKWTICQQYHGENKLYFVEIMMMMMMMMMTSYILLRFWWWWWWQAIYCWDEDDDDVDDDDVRFVLDQHDKLDCIVRAHWNISPRVDMSLFEHTFSWFRTNYSLLFFLNTELKNKAYSAYFILIIK